MVALLLASIVILPALSGCDLVNNVQGPIEATLKDGKLHVALCGHSATMKVRAETMQTSTNGDWKDFWAASSSVGVDSGSVISSQNLEQRFDNVAKNAEPVFALGDYVTVIADTENGEYAGAFKLEDKSFDGLWQRTDGSYAHEPCLDTEP
jgi:hypothetical protein